MLFYIYFPKNPAYHYGINTRCFGRCHSEQDNCSNRVDLRVINVLLFVTIIFCNAHKKECKRIQQ